MSANNIKGIHILSPMQQGILFYSLFSPHSNTYVIQNTYELVGNLEIEHLKKAWQLCLEEEDVMRSIFVWEESRKPLQCVLREVHLPWEVIDISNTHEPDKKALLDQYIETERKHKFEVAKPPLFRLILIKYAHNRHYLIWNQHHLLMDGWSSALILERTLNKYTNLKAGKNIVINPRKQFSHYIDWQKMQDQNEAADFWKTYLKDIEGPTVLNAKKISNLSLIEADDYDYHKLILSKSETTQLSTIAKTNAVTINTVIQVIWAILVSIYTGKNDIVFGITTSGRNIELESIEDMVGLFINTLPLRVNLGSKEITFSRLLKNLQENTQNIIQYGLLPLSEIQSLGYITNLKGENTRKEATLLFDHILVFENFPTTNLLEDSEVDLQIQDYKSFSVQTEFPLALSVLPDYELGFEFGYKNSCFSGTEIQALAGHLHTLLRLFCEDPNRPISKICLLTPQDQAMILKHWNETESQFLEKPLFELIRLQCELAGEQSAIVETSKRLSYQALEQLSNQWAHFLIETGVNPGKKVGVLLNRSDNLIISLLAIHKAGACYIPIDPNLPTKRIEYLLEDSAVEFLLCDKSLVKFLKFNVTMLDINELLLKIKKHPVEPPTLKVDIKSLAYIIYTSGSTGVPKGVMITHHSLTNYVQWAHAYYPNKGSGVPLYGSVAFDMIVTSLFLPLLRGKPIYIIPDEFGAEAICAVLKLDVRYDFIKLTPTHLKIIKDVITPEKLYDKTECLIVGGEKLQRSDLEFWRAASKDLRIFNEYGPTETTVACTIYEVKTLNAENYSIPIGRPLFNTKCYIIDAHLNPLPVGIEGDLYIAGVGVSQGYLNQPETTKELFIDNPFISKNDMQYQKLYRTGDRARYLCDGTIEFLGRKDEQHKIHGYRIEISEIEYVLNQHGDIAQTVVALKEVNGQTLLTAYIICGEFKVTETEIREFAKEYLPEYMIPHAFVWMTQFPVNANGKIDKSALLTPEIKLATYVAPRNKIEEKLCLIWSEVFNNQKIGIQDNFFSLGGHSLLATLLVSRLRKEFTVELPLKILFESPTIEKLSLRLKNFTKSLNITTIQSTLRPSIIPLSFAQKRLWFIEQLLPGNTLYNIPIALRVVGPLQIPALNSAFKALIERHETLRTSIHSEDGEGHQVINSIDVLNFKLECLDLNGAVEQQAEVERLVEEEMNHNFNLNSPSLMRVRLLRLNTKEHILLLTLHHIICDGWSIAIMFKELGEFYNAYCGENELNLLPLPVQYADYTLWQKTWLKGENLEKQLKYWQEQLHEAPELLELPFIKRRTKELNYKGALIQKTLSKELLDGLYSLAHAQNATLFMVLLSAFQVVLYRYTNQEDMVIGTPIANRHYQEVEGLIGFFINNLALRLKGVGEDSFIELLTRIKETTLSAYHHQDLPFEQLVDCLKISRELNRNPLFQIEFALQNFDVNPSFKFDNLSITPLDFSHKLSHFDLTMAAEESSQGLNICIEYSKNLYEDKDIEQLMESFSQLLGAILRSPDCPIAKLPIVSEQDYIQQTYAWSKSEDVNLKNSSIPLLFQKNEALMVDASAIILGNKSISFRELNEKANQIAHYLQSLGICGNVFIGVMLEKNIDLIVTMLAILKMGAVYVPLDLNYPKARLQHILEDAKAAILISNSTLYSILPHYDGKLVLLDEAEALILRESKDNLNLSYRSDDLSYVVYTSGSTGNPKGVKVTNKNLLNSMVARVEYFTDKNIIIPSLAPINFDATIMTMLWPLVTQGTLILSTQEDLVQDTTKVIDLLVNYRVNYFTCVPSFYNALLDNPNLGKLKSLKVLTLGGEEVSENLVQKHRERLPTVSLFNEYGPTECAIWASVSKLYDGNTGIITMHGIGKPILNTQFYVLDQYLNPLPKCVPGELYIGGENVTLGYLNNESLSKEKFIENKFASTEDRLMERNMRLYKTGDKVRYLDDGNLQFLGRLDNQIKIRGYRIELGEIESLLRQCAEVSEVVVKGHEENSVKSLVGYLTLKQNVKASHAQIIEKAKEHLALSVPEYMIPNFFVILDKFPVTSTGKIARNELPSPNKQILSKGYVSPKDALEEKLTEIWTHILSIEQLGIHDNFFDIGGDSIKSIQVITEAARNNMELNISDIFDFPTIHQLAKLAKPIVSNFNSLVTINEQGIYEPLFLVHPSGGVTLPYRRLSKYLPEVPLYGLSNPYFGRRDVLFKDLEEMAEYYVNEIEKSRFKGPYYLGGWSFGGEVALEMARQFKQKGKEVKLIILIDSYNHSIFQETPEDEATNDQDIMPLEMDRNYQLSSKYIPQFYDGNVVLLKATEFENDLPLSVRTAPYNGWEKVLNPLKFVTYSVPGIHTELFDEKNIASLATAVLKGCVTNFKLG